MGQKCIGAIASDIHSNSTVAVCPPRVALDDGGEYVASKAQRWLCRQWLLFWGEVFERRAELACPVHVILNGELADDNYHPTTQLITRNPADQMKLALQVLEPVTARLSDGDRLFITRVPWVIVTLMGVSQGVWRWLIFGRRGQIDFDRNPCAGGKGHAARYAVIVGEENG